MIQKLRRKFVLINMTLVTVVLLAVCGVVLVSTTQNLLARRDAALERGLQAEKQDALLLRPQIGGTASGTAGNAPHFGGEGAPADPAGDVLDKKLHLADGNSVPVFWVLTEESGAILESKSDTVTIDAETLSALTAAVLDDGKDAGTLSGYHLAYRVAQTDAGTKIVFADCSALTAELRQLALVLCLVLVCALGAFWGISIFLAGWALRPVQTAWEQQRQFVADASHELKTPLTVILANTDILLTHPEQTVAAQRKWLDSTRAEGSRMKKLIDDLLFLARADAMRVPTVKTRVDLSDLVLGTGLAFESVAFEQGITLDTDAAPGVFVTADGGALRQLTAILLDNACKYADGEKKVTLRLIKGRDTAQLAVKNTGAPIPPEQLSHLFERFYRVEESRARTAGGYGLGLAIAKVIAETNGGKIAASSDAGGTCFTVTLPLEVGAPGAKKGGAEKGNKA